MFDSFLTLTKASDDADLLVLELRRPVTRGRDIIRLSTKIVGKALFAVTATAAVITGTAYITYIGASKLIDRKEAQN